MKLLGQPSVVGELIAGIMLGPSVFGRLAPRSHEWLFGDATVQSLMFGLSWLGVIMLLVVIGFETDLAIIRRFRKAALWVSAGALLLPLGLTFMLSSRVPTEFIGEGTDVNVFGGFFALALSVSALPVVAKILQDLGFLRRNFGQITLAAGMTMDTVGWLLLAALSGIAQDGFDARALGFSFGGLVVFLLVVVFVGRPVLDRTMKLVMQSGSSRTAALTVALVAALAGAVVTQALKLEAILGAFVMGILLSTLRHQLPQVQTTLETITASVFAPIFFAFSGLRVRCWPSHVDDCCNMDRRARGGGDRSQDPRDADRGSGSGRQPTGEPGAGLGLGGSRGHGNRGGDRWVESRSAVRDRATRWWSWWPSSRRWPRPCCSSGSFGAGRYRRKNVGASNAKSCWRHPRSSRAGECSSPREAA